MGGFDDLAAQFDPVNAKRKGDQFELVCKWFLENDPTYQPLLRRVWLWNEWPGRKGIDAGIDLVAEDQLGKLWAIQAKAYDPAYSISKKDVDKFVAESSREAFTYRLLIGTTDRRHHLAKMLMEDLGIPFLGLTQLRDADNELNWPATPDALRPAKPLMPNVPHDYQQAAINDVVKGFETADRGQLIMACGTGKTLTAWFICETLKAQRTLVLVPSLSLLKQTMREWQTANPTEPFAVLPVCSDETVGSLGEDAAVSHISDLGVPVTTDPGQIATFLRQRTGPPRVVFATYQSSPQIAKAFGPPVDMTRSGTPSFDLIIADEAHRVAGPVSSDFGTVLDPEAIRAKRRLFMTATPRFFTGRVLRAAQEMDYEVASMDDHTKFGEVFHRLTFSRAIEDNLLTDYQVAIIGVDDATYRDWAERGIPVRLDGKKNTDACSLAGQIGLAKAMKKFDLHRMISFHGRVKAAKEFAASMPAVLDWMPPSQRPKGTLWSDYASGEISAGDRHVLLQHLKRLDDGERGLLANARCLSEGVDVPALDGVAFIDPRRSEVDIVQAVGRAIRKSDSKTVGTIVIPVFIDTDEDADVALNSSVFKPVWDVIKALRAHDTELGEQLDALRREMGRKGGVPTMPDKIHIDIPATVSEEFSDAFEVRLVDATTAPWEQHFGCLEEFAQREGHCKVPENLTSAGINLGNWCELQRALHRKGLLGDSRHERLESIPGWSWNLRDTKWDRGFLLLEDFITREGHSRVPKRESVDGYPLGAWVDDQRVRYHDNILDADRLNSLASLPGWSWAPTRDRWETRFTELVEFIQQHGHALVRPGTPLGRWVSKQRSKNNAGLLETSRRARLDALPEWTWGPYSDAWEEGFQHLKAFAAMHGHGRVKQSDSFSGYPLGIWVVNQRRKFTTGALDADLQRRLEQVPGWSWNSLTDNWDEVFDQLVQYANQYGHARVPQAYKSDDFPLGRWVGFQRACYSRNTLTDDRRQRLESVPGWAWDAVSARWEEFFAHLLRYVEEHGDARVPVGYKVNGENLGQWASRQRSNYAQGILSTERKRRLEKLPGWAWEAPMGGAGHRR